MPSLQRELDKLVRAENADPQGLPADILAGMEAEIMEHPEKYEEVAILLAAYKIRAYLIKRYAMEDEPEINLPVVWSKEQSAEQGFLYGGSACVQLVLEGQYDWPFAVAEKINAGELGKLNVWCEPCTGFILNCHQDWR